MKELVPGDVVLLAAGDRVPANLSLVEAVEMSLDKSSITGESLPAEKNVTGNAGSVHGSSASGRGGGMVGGAIDGKVGGTGAM